MLPFVIVYLLDEIRKINRFLELGSLSTALPLPYGAVQIPPPPSLPSFSQWPVMRWPPEKVHFGSVKPSAIVLMIHW